MPAARLHQSSHQTPHATQVHGPGPAQDFVQKFPQTRSLRGFALRPHHRLNVVRLYVLVPRESRLPIARVDRVPLRHLVAKIIAHPLLRRPQLLLLAHGLLLHFHRLHPLIHHPPLLRARLLLCPRSPSVRLRLRLHAPRKARIIRPYLRSDLLIATHEHRGDLVTRIAANLAVARRFGGAAAILPRQLRLIVCLADTLPRLLVFAAQRLHLVLQLQARVP